jgi:hypothetical protein
MVIGTSPAVIATRSTVSALTCGVAAPRIKTTTSPMPPKNIPSLRINSLPFLVVLTYCLPAAAFGVHDDCQPVRSVRSHQRKICTNLLERRKQVSISFSHKPLWEDREKGSGDKIQRIRRIFLGMKQLCNAGSRPCAHAVIAQEWQIETALQGRLGSPAPSCTAGYIFIGF